MTQPSVLELKAGLRDGVAHCAREAPEVPAQGGDAPLQAVVNEQGWFIIGSTNRGRPPREKTAP